VAACVHQDERIFDRAVGPLPLCLVHQTVTAARPQLGSTCRVSFEKEAQRLTVAGDVVCQVAGFNVSAPISNSVNILIGDSL